MQTCAQQSELVFLATLTEAAFIMKLFKKNLKEKYKTYWYKGFDKSKPDSLEKK